ncbi:MAG: hypothetical protein OER85_06660 [Gammaproteobacteria bacterium]|nr:hypothetical protein [Gammaproteobacteria bacterium]
MSGISFFRGIRTACGILILCAALIVQAHADDIVTTYKDENGWKLQVNGEDFYVKGVVWGYSPRDENYNYNLWGKSDDFIRKVLDYEFGLMKAAGVNAIRSFNIMPPKWVTYIYREHGIMTVINPLMGRYGDFIGGRWVVFVDYSDDLTRETLKKNALELVEEYKNVPGVLMFALGNESNYGLSWKSFEIENLPVGEQNTAKARYLYSLFNETMKAGKAIDPNHPFTIVNGDLQYIDLIDEYCKDMDLLGVNAYRGANFQGASPIDLWQEVDEELDLPVLFFEMGSDAFNARTFEEDQLAQARILKSQWQEMYNKAYGNGEEGNSIGAFVFEWRDEWWKYLQEERLDIHDTNASWANDAYPHDFVAGQNNMNEEWWGITRLGTANADGIYEAIPRMAYDVLSEVWSVDPYMYKKDAINQAFNDLDMEYLALTSDVRQLKNESKEERKLLFFTGGSAKVEFLQKGDEQDIDELGDAGDEFSDGQMVFLDFGFAPTKDIDGQFTVNILGNVADKDPLEIAYGRRGLPLTVQTVEVLPGFTEEVEFTRDLEDRERVEIYDFGATYRGKYADVEAFYHTPRYHWKYEGDFFGLIREATDIEGQDIWNAKAPYGVEWAGKGSFDGLKIVAGPEIYWGANPKVVLKYDSQIGKLLPFIDNPWLRQTDYTLILSEDLSRQGDGASGTAATVRESRVATLYTKTEFTNDWSLELGGIIAATNRRGEIYTRVEEVGIDAAGDPIVDIIADEIDWGDTLGFRAKLNFPFFGHLGYVATHHAGLVAEGGAPLKEFGTRLNYGDGLGNRREYEGGVMMNFGNWMLFPRYLYRENLVDANPSIPPDIDDGVLDSGAEPRNRDDDPFAVLDNREARAAEFFVTYDPTGATGFYQWDNDWREDAGFAFNIGANYTEYPTITDSYQFFFEPTGTNPAFGVNLPAEDTWELSNRIVFNPTRNLRVITNLKRAFLQSTGQPAGGTRKFWDFNAKFVIGDRHVISGYFKKDAWGAYDFQRQFNITFPEQYKLDYSILLDQRKSDRYSSKIGVYGLYRTLDENSEIDTFFTGDNDYQFQVLFYYIFNFGGTMPPAPRN